MSNPNQLFENLVMAIRLVFAKWATLTYAVESDWADGDSIMMKRLLENDLLSNVHERWNKQGKEAEIFVDEISDFLLAEMEHTFNCSLEDGSNKEIAHIIVGFYSSSRGGDPFIVNNFIQQNESLIPSVMCYLEATKSYQQFEEEGVDYDNDQFEEIDSNAVEESKPKNQPDEDGWTVV